MGAERFMELIAGHTELLGPIGDVGGHLGIDLLRVVRPFDVFLMGGVRFVSLGGVVVLGHGAPSIGSLIDEERLIGDVRVAGEMRGT
jgi:hypothetical protein